MDCLNFRTCIEPMPYPVLYALMERVITADEPAMLAIEHARECMACKEWADKRIPEKYKRRQARLKRYCCAGMFVAVEEARGGEFRLHPRYITDEVMWIVADNRPVGVTAFRFCPWCAKELPRGAFIDDDEGWDRVP